MSEQVKQWWITTDFFDNGGEKVMGPFISRRLAIDVRVLRESYESRADYFIDCEYAPADPTTTASVGAPREER
jgi:hypothetical protein